LVAIPDPCNTVEDLEGFVNGLLAWAEALDRKDVRILISQACIDALYQDDRYPYDHHLRALLSKHTVDGEAIADEDTIAQVARRLFEQTPYLEEFIGIEVIDIEKKCITPVEFLDRLSANTSQAFQESLVMLGVWHHHKNAQKEPVDGCTFAARFGESVKHHNELTVQAEVSDVLFSDETSPDSLPITVEESFHLCFGHTEVLKQFDCTILWGNADSEQGAIDAIQQRINALIEQGSSTSNKELPYSLGAHFLESARNWGFTRSDLASNLIESCARIIIQNPKYDLNEFRISKNSPKQRTRKSDGATAWRTHLTKKGAGYRLMFWKTTEGKIEFANVGSKFELEIRE
jgi:hypothetical protein